MGNKKVLILSMLGSAILAVLMYIVIHELGHTLVAIACGAKITKFSIFSASMSYIGGNFNPFSESLSNVAGALFPVILLLFFLLFIFDQKRTNVFQICISMFLIINTTFAILSWIIIPIISMFSEPPIGDDVTKFMVSSQLHPIIIIFGAFILMVLLIMVAFYKGIFKSFFNLRKKYIKRNE